ncbi:MAG: hypothetical protein HYV07_10095 [Deltaproteobacteria bacterium]|nr:hypothetical protein [Deltaproteobacteria bacterium]
MYERIVCLKLTPEASDEAGRERAERAVRAAFPGAWIGRPSDEKSRASWDLAFRVSSLSFAEADAVVGSESWTGIGKALGKDLAVLKTWGFETVEDRR